MNKKSQKIIDEKLSRCLTVKELIEYLKTLPQDAYVGKAGHFGEFYTMSSYDFSLREAYVTDWSWRSEDRKNIICVNVSTPDVGPEPD